MKARIISSVAAAGVLALVVSCSQDQTRGISVPTEASYAKPPAAPTCSFSTANNDAKAYFVDQKDAAFALIDTMQTAVRTYGITSAETKLAGMKVLARLGTAAQNGVNQVKGTPTTTGALGNKFANDVLLCMNTASINFTDALGPTGLFAVRDGTDAHAQAVVAHNWDANGVPLSGALAPMPLYGAEPNGGNWPVSQKVLFYGKQLTDATSLANEAPAGVVFDLKTLPADPFTAEFRVGVCDVSDGSARTLHSHEASDGTTSSVVLPPLENDLGFCSNPPALEASRSGFGSIMQLAASWFTPKSLFAMPTLRGGGGLVSGLSEIGPVTYTPVVTFTVPPKNSRLSATNPQFKDAVTVTVLTSHGNPLKHVLVTLTVVGNSGSFKNPPDGSAPAYTDEHGVVQFPSLYIDKAGGYTITATSDVGGSASAFFNISGR
jgi:hypothetical protein